jgi:hypothetical protein
VTATLEKWLDKRGLAEHLSCSVRSIQTALAEGMPHTIIFGRVKFHATAVEEWLEANGHLERRGHGILGAGNVDGPPSARTPTGREINWNGGPDDPRQEA